MSKKIKRGKSPYTNWMIMQSFIILLGSVLVAELVDFVANYIFYQNYDYHPITGIGMILPMGIITGFISYFTLKKTNKYTQTLLDGITEVANGNFHIALNAETAGPYKDLVKNFNKMTLELQSVQSLRNDFINNFSHEFRTPIASIQGFAELLLEEQVEPEKQRQFLQIIAQESERLTQLTNSTMLLSSLETQQIVIDKELYALDEQIKQCVILLSPQWIKKELTLSVDLDEISYEGNMDLMEHIWINLLNNAIKFTPPGGEIELSLVQRNNEIIFSISDTGAGISSTQIANIFTKYYRGDAAIAEKGLGLGLSIVSRVVDLCQGRIDVNSIPDKGSVFKIYLPAQKKNY